MIQSYKQYLLFLEEKANPKIFKKAKIGAFISLLLIVGVLSAYLYFHNQKVSMANANIQYLDMAQSSLITSENSVSELIATFQVAGAKTQQLEETKETFAPTIGFVISLDDSQKTLNKIETTRQNASFQKKLLEETKVPKSYNQLNSQLINVYGNIEKYLDDLYNEHDFAKALLLVLGPNFYLPQLTNENVWTSGSKDEIRLYYIKTAAEAKVTLDNLANLSVPKQFENYFIIQSDYLKQVAAVSENIIETLKGEDNSSEDFASQLEQAYQILIRARIENEALSKKLLEERAKLFSIKDNYAEFAPIKIELNSLQAKFDEFANFKLNQSISPLNWFQRTLKLFSL